MKRKKVTALLLAVVMTAGMMAGCGNNSTSPEEGEQVNTEETSREENEGAETGEMVLPLTDEKITLSMYMPMDVTYGVYSTDYNDSEFFKKMEELTNVHIEFVVPPAGEEMTNFNLMFTSGELPDLITGSSLYTGGVGAGIDDGYYLDLTEYLDTCLVNYNKIRMSSEDIKKDTTLDDGRVGAVYEIRVGKEGAWGGYQIRQDWLDELGLETPVTYADWEKVLTAFKEEKGATAPLALTSYGYDVVGDLSAGFGAAPSPGFIQIDGKVIYSPITDGWKEYLQLMNDWYSKGLVNPDFMTSTPYFADTELIVSGQSGIWFSMAKLASSYEAASDEINVVALQNPVKNAGDETHIRIADSLVTASGGGCSISTDCEYPEIAMKWLDFLYTEAGSMLAGYGEEGVSYTVEEDGTIAFTDMINNNPDGYDPNTAMVIYALVPSKLPSYYHFEREFLNMSEKDVQSFDIWGQEWEKDDYVLPGAMSMTIDEADTYSAYYTDISSYMNETTLKFITGVLDVNGSDWDDYVATIESMGIQECLELQQAALDRYNAR